jgi:hypothetical protein
VTSGGDLSVTSHVGRDLLQSAALFKHEHSVVWEYVSNGLEYVEHGVNPIVKVVVDSKGRKITVQDNGRGMIFSDLHRYFQMHGENIDRQKGKPGRGLFGTGKSAAFGIAKRLRVTTTRNGRRSRVELDRNAIESKEAERSVPVRILEREIATSEPNGTLVEIEDIQLKRVDPTSVIRHIERHIAHWPNATVFVNTHKCEFVEPLTAFEREFKTVGTDFDKVLGDVTLIVKVSKAPLEEEFQGISITSGAVWHEVTLSGCDRKPFANYLFGQFEVPALAADKSLISPFDMSRSMRLNPRNETVAKIYAFIGTNLERVRQELEESDRKRRKADDAKKLEKEAQAIAEIINKDFAEWRNQVHQVAAQVSGRTDTFKGTALGEEEDVYVPGDDLRARTEEEVGGPGPMGSGKGDAQSTSTGGPQLDPVSPEPDTTADRTKGKPKPAVRSGGFKVDFKNMGLEEARAKYERDNRTIYINLDHPQIAAASRRVSLEDPSFRRLAYEVAFTEYAIALASEMAGTGYYLDVVDPITDIRLTVNRLAVAGAGLYG